MRKLTITEAVDHVREIALDGVPVNGVTDITLSIPVGDVSRATLDVLVIAGEVEVGARTEWTVSVAGPDIEPRGHGASLSVALRDLAARLEAEASA